MAWLGLGMMGHIDFYRQLTCVSFVNSYRPIYLKGLSPTSLSLSIPTRTGGWLRSLCKGVRPLHRQAWNCENQQESPLIVETFTWGPVWGSQVLAPLCLSLLPPPLHVGSLQTQLLHCRSQDSQGCGPSKWCFSRYFMEGRD